MFSNRKIAALLSGLKAHPRAALAVSGGPDSMALLGLARRWCALSGRVPASIWVLSVDHGLRPQAAQEAAHVARTAQALGFNAAVLAWVGDKPERAIQAAARQARYRLITGFCRSHGITALVTAHTLDDQAETFLMRLGRGSGLDGLSAMAAEGTLEGIAILRPLIGVSKARLTAFARAEGLKFFHDPSNENPRFERPRLRAQMKALTGCGITRRALAQSAGRLGRARAALEAWTEDVLGAHFRISAAAAGEFPKAALSALPDEIYLKAMARALDLIGGVSPAPRLVKLERLLTLRGASAWQATLGGCLLRADENAVRIVREFGRMRLPVLRLEPGQHREWDRRFTLALGADESALEVRPLGPEGAAETAAKAKKLGIAEKLDVAAAASTPAFWRGGERIAAPLGCLLGTGEPALEHAQGRLPRLSLGLVPALNRYAK